VAVARELTKLYETVVRGTLGSVDIGEPRGEYVIVLGGAPAADADVDDEIIATAVDAELAAGASKRDAAARTASALGVPRRRAYDIAVKRR
jgi:16S rRNA (cytidine1402-2'-O)-methyltransferase